MASIDIDYFKKINDTHGHDGGDVILQQVAAVLRGQTRGSDTVCRVGGEEFLIIFPSQSIEEAGVCAERCRAAVGAYAFTIGKAQVKVTVSIGLATRTRDMIRSSDMLKAADQALYAAKDAGRHVVCIAKPWEGAEPAGRSASTQDSTPISPVIKEQSDPVDMNSVLKRCGGDAAFAAAVTARFRAQAGEEVAMIERAFAENNVDSLRRTAHSLKSMAAYMSADVASSVAGQIEQFVRDNRTAEVAPLISQLHAEIGSVIAWLASHPAAPGLKCA